MKVAIAGYRGFIGQELVKKVEGKGMEWVALSRQTLYGDKTELAEKLEGADAVINVAGTSIAKRWTRKRMKKIEASRYGLNTRIVEAIHMMRKKPGVFISTSAVGIYENQGEHTEQSTNYADNYLAEVVSDWEKPLKKLDRDVKQVAIRIGVVLERNGGALQRMMMTRPYGFLVIPGNGKQALSFIHMEDLQRAIIFILDKKMTGVVNMCAPQPTTMEEFIRELSKKTRTPFVFRVPEFIMKIGLGRAHIVITEGQKVLPERLMSEGFSFRFGEIGDTVDHIFSRN